MQKSNIIAMEDNDQFNEKLYKLQNNEITVYSLFGHSFQ